MRRVCWRRDRKVIEASAVLDLINETEQGCPEAPVQLFDAFKELRSELQTVRREKKALSHNANLFKHRYFEHYYTAQQQLAEAKQDLASLQQQFAEHRATSNSLVAGYIADKSRLVAEVAATQQQLEDALQQYWDADTEANQLREDKAALESEHNSLLHNYSLLDWDYQAEQQWSSHLSAQRNTLLQQYSLASHLITERSILIGRQRDRLLDLEDGVTELENRLVDTAERLENEKTLSASLGQQLAAAREQLEDALTQIQQLQAAEQSLDTLQVSE